MRNFGFRNDKKGIQVEVAYNASNKSVIFTVLKPLTEGVYKEIIDMCGRHMTMILKDLMYNKQDPNEWRLWVQIPRADTNRLRLRFVSDLHKVALKYQLAFKRRKV